MKEHKLWYAAPAADWNAALPLGGGRLGVMLYGGVDAERLQLNEETFWSGQPYFADNPETLAHLDEMRELVFAGKYAEAEEMCIKYLVCRGPGSRSDEDFYPYGSYQTAGELTIDFAPRGKCSTYRRELDLRRGVASVACSSPQCETVRSCFVNREYNVIVYRVKGADVASIDYTRNVTEGGAAPCEILRRPLTDGECIEARGTTGPALRWAVGIRLRRRKDETVIMVSIATDYADKTASPSDRVDAFLDAAEKTGADALFAGHIAEFTEVMDRARIDLGEGRDDLPTDERIAAGRAVYGGGASKHPGDVHSNDEPSPEALAAAAANGFDAGLCELYYSYGRYLLYSSSAPGSVLPANLQGIWCRDYIAPWKSDYHININIQMNYWPAEVCDLPETTSALLRYIEFIADHGALSARTAYGCHGWVAHAVTNPWGFTSLGEHPSWGSFMCAGAWMCRHIRERYLYSGDIGVLRRYYPVLRGACEFFLDFLTEDPRTGNLVTAPSNSPENHFIDPRSGEIVSICAGPTMDNSILRELFTFTADSASDLAAEDPLFEDCDFITRINRAKEKLPPLSIGRYGQIMEWSEDFEESEPGHRHMSQLYSLHPGCEITEDTPELFRAAGVSLRRRLDNGGGHTGWSRAWVINFFARLLNGDDALSNLRSLIAKCTLPNMFDTHPPFQIDGNFGGCAGIAEMLIQSHDGTVRVLPALPSDWHDGSFSALRARGGFAVSAVWKNNRVVSCSVTSTLDAHLKIEVNGVTTERDMAKGETADITVSA